MELVNSHPQILLLPLTQDVKLGKTESAQLAQITGLSMLTMFVNPFLTFVKLMKVFNAQAVMADILSTMESVKDPQQLQYQMLDVTTGTGPTKFVTHALLTGSSMLIKSVLQLMLSVKHTTVQTVTA